MNKLHILILLITAPSILLASDSSKVSESFVVGAAMGGVLAVIGMVGSYVFSKAKKAKEVIETKIDAHKEKAEKRTVFSTEPKQNIVQAVLSSSEETESKNIELNN